MKTLLYYFQMYVKQCLSKVLCLKVLKHSAFLAELDDIKIFSIIINL